MCVFITVCPADLENRISKMLPNHTKVFGRDEIRVFILDFFKYVNK